MSNGKLGFRIWTTTTIKLWWITFSTFDVFQHKSQVVVEHPKPSVGQKSSDVEVGAVNEVSQQFHKQVWPLNNLFFHFLTFS